MRLKPFRIIGICLYVVIVYNVVMSIWLLANSVLAISKRNHLLWNLGVRGKNPTLIASPPKTMGWVVRVSSNFKLKFVSKRSKNDTKKNYGEFFETWKSRSVQIDFFSKDSPSYM